MFNRGCTGFFSQGWELPGEKFKEDAGVGDLGNKGFVEVGLGEVSGEGEFVGSFYCVVEIG